MFASLSKCATATAYIHTDMLTNEYNIIYHMSLSILNMQMKTNEKTSWKASLNLEES